MIVCGELNASHSSWSPTGKTAGDKELLEILRPFQRKDPCATDGVEAKRLQIKRGRLQCEAIFALKAPRRVTHPFLTMDRAISGSKIDLPQDIKGIPPPIPTITSSPAACASDHMPIETLLTQRDDKGRTVKEFFLPTTHRQNSEAADAALELYRGQMPSLTANLRAFGSKLAFVAHVDELQTMIRSLGWPT